MSVYLPPKTRNKFNVGDFNYQDKNLTVKEMNLVLDSFEDNDTTHSADIAVLQTKTTDQSYTTALTTFAGAIKPASYDFCNATQISTGMANNTVCIVPNPDIKTNYTGFGSCLIGGAGCNKLVSATGFQNAMGYLNFAGGGTHAPTGPNTIIGNYFARNSSFTGTTNVVINCSNVTSSAPGSNLSSGSKNVLIGDVTGGLMTTGIGNIGIGSYALVSVTTATGNVALGCDCFRHATGSYNIAVGCRSQRGVSGQTTGNQNVSIGENSLYGITSGHSNTSLGSYSGNLITTGIRNSFLGYNSGASNTTGSNNTFLGYNAGNGIDGTLDNKIYLGNTSITNIYSQVTSIDALSDARDKCDIEELMNCFNSTDFINKLKPKCYKYDNRSRYKNVDVVTTELNEDGEEVEIHTLTDFEQDGSKKDTFHSIGLIAQDVQIAEQELGICEPTIYHQAGENMMTIGYTRLIPVLIQALKESNERINNLMMRVQQLEAQ